MLATLAVPSLDPIEFASAASSREIAESFASVRVSPCYRFPENVGFLRLLNVN